MKPRPEIVEFLEKNKFRRFCNSYMMPKPEKGHCKWCGGKLPQQQRVWCCDECQNEAYIRFGYLREVWLRDKGICAICGIDTSWLQSCVKEIKEIQRRFRHVPFSQFKKDLGPWFTHNRCLYEMDHILPVSRGGGLCGLENYRTLCLRCHKKETAKLAATKEQLP